MTTVRDVTNYQIFIDKTPLTVKMIRFNERSNKVDVKEELEGMGLRMAEGREIDLLLMGYPDLKKKKILPLGSIKNGRVLTNQSDLWIAGIPFKCVLNTIKPRN